MTYLRELPKDVAHLIQSRFVTEYASVSAAGVPIDTPLCLCPSADLTSLDVTTGLAYPVKAERARRNPKVGLFIEGGPQHPAISIAGLAAVRDANIQANLNRYMAETIIQPPASITDWNITRKAVWYFSRVFVCVTPVHIRWWKNRVAMDGQPQEWRAPAGTTFPQSDPPPRGAASDAPHWAHPSWRDLAKSALARNVPAHLTLLDGGGYPLPIRVRELKLRNDGFELAVPKGAPWSQGKATLSFEGREIFVGDATPESGDTLLRVERCLPVLPLTEDHTEVLQPKPGTQATLMKRLEHELGRRGQQLPTIQPEPPQPTDGARLRQESIAEFLASAPPL
jgi:hypothetical protein